MSRARIVALAERRARLVERAGHDRAALAALLARTDAPVQAAAQAVAQGRRLFGELRKHPAIVAAGVALLVALRPRRAFGWILKGWSAWRVYSGARRWWRQQAAEPR